jgi:hypothetical protein
MVLVFVPADVKPEALPPALAAGLGAKEVSGIIPNMVVVDATATALIVGVPSGSNSKAAGEDRDKAFIACAAVMQHWLSYHPMAIAAPEARQATR